MKKMTRLLCLLLCAVLVCGMLPPVAASAAQAEPGQEDGWKYVKEEETQEETPAVELLAVEKKEEAPALDVPTEGEYGGWNIESFADLKEVLAAQASNPDWISIYYVGSEPLVITESITIPGSRSLDVGGELRVAEGVTLTVEHTGYSNGAIRAGELQIDGTLVNNGSLNIGKKLTVNGSLVTDGFSVDYTAQIVGVDKIQFEDEWSYISLDASAQTAEEFYQILEVLAGKVGGRIKGYVSLWTGLEETGIVLTKSVTVSEGVSVSVSGEYPLVIDSGCTLTMSDEDLYFDNIVVKGTLILPQDCYVDGDVLQIDGTVDAESSVSVSKKLTVNGTFKARFVDIGEDVVLEGIEKIKFKEADYMYGPGMLTIRYNAETAEDFYQDLADAASKTGENIQCDISLNVYEEGASVLNKSFAIPENVTVYLNGDATYTIPEGCTATVDGGMNIWAKTVLKGNLVLNEDSSVSMDSDGFLEISGGKITGKGGLSVWAEDPTTLISGLDMNKYEAVEQWENSWIIYNVEGLTKLAAPAAPKWGIRYEFEWNPAEEKSDIKEYASPASIAMKGVDGAESISIKGYFEGPNGPELVSQYRFGMGSGDVRSLDIFQDESRPSGVYYFTVQAIGDYETTRSSDIVTSEKYTYTNPGKRLDKVSNLKAENDVITWAAHPQADLVDFYSIYVWFAPTADAEPENMWWYLDSDDNSAVLPERIKQDIGEGYYYFEVVAHPKDATKATVSVGVMSNPMKVELPETVRYAGKDRFETSFKVADAIKKYSGDDKLSYVIVASGANFADALAGSYLSFWYGAPILLSYKDKQNNEVKEYIKENLADNGVVFILGGENAVPKSMEVGLEAYRVVRLAGDNRFLTNLKILERTKIPNETPILVATGSNFADSLSASAVGLPILLVHKKLTDEQKDFLAKHADAKKNPIIILGGKSAVNETVEGEFKALGFKVERLAGENRFQTSVMIAERFFGEPSSAVLAYAANYPDGLCGGGLAVWMNAPLILTMDKQVAVAAEYAKKVGIERTVTLGGEGLISDAAVNTILGK